ncbi:MAG: DUF6599 family protein [Acidobacteriota bacterium]
MKLYFRSILLLFIFFLSGDLLTGEIPKDSTISLPDSIRGWEIKGEPETYKGDDLFLYINGGADIYHEYGFEEVLSSEYEKAGAGRISVEIYRMKDPGSAFGIFTFKTGGKWKRTGKGNLYSSEDYYLNILLGKNLVTITSIDINKETGKGIGVIRNKLEERITSPVFYPDIVKYIDPEKYEKRIYFKGDMGLMNIYNLFSAGSGIVHGSSGTNNENTVLLLEFNKSDDPQKRLDLFTALLRKEGRYSDFITEGKSTSFSDRKKRKLFLTIFEKFIVISLSRTLIGCISAAKDITNYISAFK